MITAIDWCHRSDFQQPAQIWTAHAQRWTWWNTLRPLFSLASLLLVGLALFVSGRKYAAEC